MSTDYDPNMLAAARERLEAHPSDSETVVRWDPFRAHMHRTHVIGADRAHALIRAGVIALIDAHDDGRIIAYRGKDTAAAGIAALALFLTEDGTAVEDRDAGMKRPEYELRTGDDRSVTYVVWGAARERLDSSIDAIRTSRREAALAEQDAFRTSVGGVAEDRINDALGTQHRAARVQQTEGSGWYLLVGGLTDEQITAIADALENLNAHTA